MFLLKAEVIFLRATSYYVIWSFRQKGDTLLYVHPKLRQITFHYYVSFSRYKNRVILKLRLKLFPIEVFWIVEQCFQIIQEHNSLVTQTERSHTVPLVWRQWELYLRFLFKSQVKFWVMEKNKKDQKFKSPSSALSKVCWFFF